VLFGPFFLQDLVSTHYILYTDSDIPRVKPWLVPLAADISSANKSNKLMWGGHDWELVGLVKRVALKRRGVSPHTYININTDFFLFWNITDTKPLMNGSVELWMTHRSIWFQDQTILNIVFDTFWKGFLSEQFEK
jgi:hypothetical protein